MKHELAKRCPGARVWPKRLCQAILKGFIAELEERSLHAAFADEFSAEVEDEFLQPLGHFDAIYDDKGLAKNTAFDHKTTEAELQCLESLEGRQDLSDSSALESTRHEKWLRASRSLRVALRRLRTMLGHCSNSSLFQVLRTAGASSSTIEAARHCLRDMQKNSAPSTFEQGHTTEQIDLQL